MTSKSVTVHQIAGDCHVTCRLSTVNFIDFPFDGVTSVEQEIKSTFVSVFFRNVIGVF